MPIKILLADDSEIVRRGIRNLLSEEPSILLVGEATSFAETIQMTAELQPDVLLIDCHMPDKDYVSKVKAALGKSAIKVLAISFSPDEEAKYLAECVGAPVLLDKMELSNKLIPMIYSLVA